MKIHILGPSGSGTTTLGKALAKKLKIRHFDSDDFFWIKTDPPFFKKRPADKRALKLKNSLKKHGSWILSGSMLKWGDFLIPEFDIIIYKYLEPEERIRRLIKREKEHFGDRIEKGNDMHEIYNEFIEWAKTYETGGMDSRSRISEEEWMNRAKCRIIRIVKELSIDEEVNIVLNEVVGGLKH
jgi:adenylate kinase family enzyme